MCTRDAANSRAFLPVKPGVSGLGSAPASSNITIPAWPVCAPQEWHSATSGVGIDTAFFEPTRNGAKH